jgi:branched-chain amino acid transport system ATP-binding protein
VLSVRDLDAHFGGGRVLRGVCLDVGPGEIVTLVGRNGAGKTTTLRCIMGLHRQMAGEVRFGDRPLGSLPPFRRARLGLGYVPDDRGVYSRLTVEEHLTLVPKVDRRGWSLDRVYSTFPSLRERRDSTGTSLSGGEQQMLALARVLRMGASLLLCDEPTEGLSPLFVSRVGEILREIKADGTSVLLIEQNVHFAATVADRHYLLAQGSVVSTLDNSEVRQREKELLDHLGI